MNKPQLYDIRVKNYEFTALIDVSDLPKSSLRGLNVDPDLPLEVEGVFDVEWCDDMPTAIPTGVRIFVQESTQTYSKNILPIIDTEHLTEYLNDNPDFDQWEEDRLGYETEVE